MSKFVVSPKCSVLFRGKIYTKGMEIPGLPPHSRKEHLESGFMVEEGSREQAAAVYAPPPGTTAPIPIGEQGTDGDAKPIEIEQPKSAFTKEEPEKVSTPVEDKIEGKKGSVWILDPDGLRSKSLEELNVMVIERQPELEPFETYQEAVAWLSQDYVEPVKVG